MLPPAITITWWDPPTGPTPRLKQRIWAVTWPNLWVDLGSPFLGTGSVSYLRDQVPTGAPQRFYRVLATP